MNQTLRKLRGMAHVGRWNFQPRSRFESVAEHSFFVATIAYRIAQLSGMEVDDCRKFATWGLFHDMEESITSDLPYLVKRSTPQWSTTVEEAQRELFGDNNGMRNEWSWGHGSSLVKLADILAALQYADEEVTRGNGHFRSIRGELMGLFNKMVNAETEHVKQGALLVAGEMLLGNFQPYQAHKEMSHL